jgi:hypothetical protein
MRFGKAVLGVLMGLPALSPALALAQSAVASRSLTIDVVSGPGPGRPIMASPGLSADKPAGLRDAFATMKCEVGPNDSAHLEALVQEIYASPKEIIEKMKPLMP